jgi:hypothetical protein
LLFAGVDIATAVWTWFELKKKSWRRLTLTSQTNNPPQHLRHKVFHLWS